MAKQSHDAGVRKARKNLEMNPPPLTHDERLHKRDHERGQHKHKRLRKCRLCYRFRRQKRAARA